MWGELMMSELRLWHRLSVSRYQNGSEPLRSSQHLVVWQACLLSHCRCTPQPKCAHVTLRHQRLTPRLCVLREEAHPPPSPTTHWSSPSHPGPGLGKDLLFSDAFHTLWFGVLKFVCLFSSLFWLVSYRLSWYMRFPDDVLFAVPPLWHLWCCL